MVTKNHVANSITNRYIQDTTATHPVSPSPPDTAMRSGIRRLSATSLAASKLRALARLAEALLKLSDGLLARFRPVVLGANSLGLSDSFGQTCPQLLVMPLPPILEIDPAEALSNHPKNPKNPKNPNPKNPKNPKSPKTKPKAQPGSGRRAGSHTYAQARLKGFGLENPLMAAFIMKPIMHLQI